MDDVITSNIMLQFIIQKKIFHIAVSLHSNRSSLDDVNMFKSLKQVIERKAWLPRQQDKDKLIRRRC